VAVKIHIVVFTLTNGLFSLSGGGYLHSGEECSPDMVPTYQTTQHQAQIIETFESFTCAALALWVKR
jgi:hypothetical protein